LFIEDLESNDRVEVFPGEEFSFEYILEANEDNHSSEIDKDLEQISILERYQLLIASPEFEEVTEDSPEQIELNQNYPNPFNPATTISFVLPEAVEVKLSVFNVVGQPIAVLEEGTLSPGEHHYEWNASGYPSGMYIYQLEVGTKVMTRKMTLVK
ncbi:MAG: T9SS type A sorting domain-containing protein, partial [Balneolaceae bacterium]